MKKRARQQKKLTVRMLSLIMASLLLLLVIPFAAIASGQESPEPGKKGDFRLFKDFYATTKVTLTEDQESSVTVSAELSENEIYVKSYQWQAYSLGARRYVNMGQYGKSVSINENLVSAYDYGNGNSYLRCKALVSDSDMQQMLTSDVLTVVLPPRQTEPSQADESGETAGISDNTDPTGPEETGPTSAIMEPTGEPSTTTEPSTETTGAVTSPTGADKPDEKTPDEEKPDGATPDAPKGEPTGDENAPVKGKLLEPLVADGEDADGAKEGGEGENSDMPPVRGMLLAPLMRDASTVTITFDLDGGEDSTFCGAAVTEGVCSVSAQSGDAQLIDTPTRSGYIFKGWTLTSPEGLAADVQTELENCADNGNLTVPEVSVTFRATWEQEEQEEPGEVYYTIVYYVQKPLSSADKDKDDDYEILKTAKNSSQAGANITLSSSQIKLYTTAENNYYSLYTAKSNTNGTVAADSSTVFKLYFTRKTYTINFDLTADLIGSITQHPELNNKTSYSFTAKYGEDIREKWPDETWVTQWPITRIGISIRYNVFQGTQYGSNEIIYANPIYLTNAIVTSGGTTSYTYKVLWSTRTLFGQSYTFNYYFMDTSGNYPGSPSSSYTASSNQFSYSSDAPEIVGFKTPNVSSSGITYNIKYERKKYTLSFKNTDDTTASASKSVYYEKSLAEYASTTPTKTGYVFEGWYTDQSLTTQMNWNSTMPANNLTVYAKWTKAPKPQSTVTVYTYKDDSNVLQSLLAAITTDTGTPAKPSSEVQNRSRDGYRFVRWVVNGTNDTFVFNQTPVNSNITVYGEWENAIVNYTVSFYLDKGNMTGTPHHSETVEKDGTVGSFAAPGRTGYDFAGWYYGEGAGKMPFRFTGDSNPTVITSDMNVYAEWTIHSHKFIVKFKDDQGNERENSRDDKDYGASISQPTGLSWEGRTFTNEWYNDSGLTDRLTSWPITMPDSDKTVYAKWTVNSYSVRFYGDENDTNPRLTTSVLYNGTVDGNLTTDWGPLNAQSDQPSRNRAFDGWYYYDGAEKKTFVLGADGTKITGNTKVYINWAPMYTVKFYSDSTLSGDPLASETVKSGDRIAQAPADPTSVDGSQTFNGWYYNAGTVETPDIQPFTFGATGVAVDKNIDVYAAWLDNEITLIIHNNASRVNIFYITKSDESGFRLRVAVAGNSGSTTVVHLPFTQSASGTSMYTVTPEGWDYRNNYSPVSSLVNEENGGILAANQTYHVTFGGTSKGLNWLGGYSPFPPASN